MSDEPRDGTNGERPTDTGRAAGTGNDQTPAADSSHVPSAPWERPRRWNQDSLDATRVDDLLAKLGSNDDVPSGRRRRRQEDAGDTSAVSASDLIAALSGDEPAPADHPAEAKPDHHQAAAPAPAREVPAHEDPAHDVPARDVPARDVPARDVPIRPVVEAAPVSPPAADRSDVPGGAGGADLPGEATTVLAPGTVPPSFAPAPADASQDHTTVLPPRIGPDDRAPIRDLGDDPRTDYIPKLTGSAADRAEADSILASLRRQSRSDGSAAAAVYGSAVPGSATYASASHGSAGSTGGRTPPPPTGGGHTDHAPSDPPPRRRRGLLYAGRSIAAIVALITLLGVGVEWKIKDRADAGLRASAVIALNTTDPSISTARTAPLVVTNSQGVKTTESAPPKASYAPENILLLGSDTRSGANGDAGNQGAGTAGTANSDTLMVAHISGDRSHVTILSIPRDTLIPAPKCKIWNSSTGKLSDQYQPISAGEIYHINSAYSVGGPQCTVTAVQSMTGLGITRLIGIDFVGFQAMVDALGGINVNICRPIVDSVLGTVVPTAGEQKIFGGQALNLVRARDVIGDDLSDLARIRRQQVVLSAILRQVTQAGTLLNPAKLDNFLQAFTKNTFNANIKVDDLITLAGSLGSLDPAHVTFYTLPTVPSTTIDGALDVDKTKASVVFDDLINDLPLPGETTAAATTKASSTPVPPAPTTSAAPSLKLTVAPSKVDLEIYNLTGQANVATTAQQKLNAVGFNVSDTQLFKPDSDTQTGTTVLYAAANRAAALTVAAAVPGSTLVVTPGLGSTVRLNLGSSYAGSVSSVKVGDTAPSSLATVSTGPAVSATAGSSTPSTVPSTLASTALSSVNAAAGTCV